MRLAELLEAAMSAAIAAADVPIFTADNPRAEDPRAIIDAMLSSLAPGEQACVRVELDRSRAIEQAVHAAEPGDVILLVGKGHESQPPTLQSAAKRATRAAASDALTTHR